MHPMKSLHFCFQNDTKIAESNWKQYINGISQPTLHFSLGQLHGVPAPPLQQPRLRPTRTRRRKRRKIPCDVGAKAQNRGHMGLMGLSVYHELQQLGLPMVTPSSRNRACELKTTVPGIDVLGGTGASPGEKDQTMSPPTEAPNHLRGFGNYRWVQDQTLEPSYLQSVQELF